MYVDLFSEPLYEIFNGISCNVKERIEGIELADIDRINDIANEIYRSNHLVPITLLDFTRRVETRVVPVNDYFHNTVVDAKREVYTFKITFKGTWQLFEYHGSSYRDEIEDVVLSSNFIEFDVVNEFSDRKAVSKEYQKIISEIEWNLDKINEEVERFDSSLIDSITFGIRARLEYLEKRNREEDELGLPPLESNQNLIDIPIDIVPVIDLYVEHFEHYSESQYRISEQVFDKIIAAIRRSAIQMERHPEAFNLDEESLRFHIISLVDGLTSLQGTGESKEMAGKTDILYSYRGHIVLIAECKIWKGISYVAEGLEQLESYLSWDDTKTSLVIFYKNKGDMTNSIIELNEFITSRSNYSRTISYDVRGSRYLMKHPTDSLKTYTLQVLFFDLSYSK